ncbi:MAG: 50S ribosomal protein L18 [Candidatus Diapherotrites archaeon]|nr:50S ribosomal protein L18 [Candidatus Diapherotrites archaeon]
MSKTSTFTTRFRRRAIGKTNYRKREAMAKSGLPRLVVRKSNRFVIAQLVQFDPTGDRTLVHVNSRTLERFGWKAGKKSLPAAYLTGLLAGVMAKKKKIDKAILDIGFATPVHGSHWAAALKGAIDAGLAVNAEKSALPSEDRLQGKHIELFAKKLGEKGIQLRFGAVAKAGADLQNLSGVFAAAKQKILGGK